MDARITREETALLLNLSPSRHAQQVEEIRLAAIRARDEAIGRAIRNGVISLFRTLRSIGQFLITYPERRALFDELHAMSDRQLADIGLTRGDLARVFDADFSLARPPAKPAPAAPATVTPPEPANSNIAVAKAA